jgi:hypothetical protein
LFVVEGGGAVFVVTADHLVYRLTEKELADKLDILTRKHLYPLAVQLGFNSQLPRAAMVEIHHQFGDHLFEKGDFDGAIAQYTHTIGFLNSSVVIAKFLGAHHVQQLMAFLEALHERQHEPGARFTVKPLHTTLLLNCYTKLMDLEKLERFILQDNGGGGGAEGGGGGGGGGTGAGAGAGAGGSSARAATFDVGTAIQVLRSSYPELALALARREQQHDWYFRIRLEERQLAGVGSGAAAAAAAHAADQPAAGGLQSVIEEEALEDAMAYLLGLPFDFVVTQLQRWGKTLVEYLPDEMTDLLSALCTGCYEPLPELAHGGFGAEAAAAAAAAAAEAAPTQR